MARPIYYIYILICENGHYYTGITLDLRRRYQEHLAGSKKCKYTRSFKPLAIAQSWPVNGNKADAMRIERAIKKLNKKAKQKLIDNPNCFAEWFSK